jgi:hypothetical protein
MIKTYRLLVKIGWEKPWRVSHPLSFKSSPPSQKVDTRFERKRKRRRRLTRKQNTRIPIIPRSNPGLVVVRVPGVFDGEAAR